MILPFQDVYAEHNFFGHFVYIVLLIDLLT